MPTTLRCRMRGVLAGLLLAGAAARAATPAAGAPDAAAPDVPALLRAADAYRVGDDDQQVETLVRTRGADGVAARERRYTVFAQAGHRSLVLMRSPAEAGQKVLMLGDDFWLLMPSSQRPMRITPMQKLLGDASTGDIATLSWAQDYTGTVAGEEACGEPVQPCVRLALQATRKAVTYQRIELWIGRRHREPVAADLYVQSDRLAKRARFVVDRPEAPTRVTAMLLRDQLTHRHETEVHYVERRPRKVPDTWLNPMFLTRNPTLE